jgi:hypothetical protein
MHGIGRILLKKKPFLNSVCYELLHSASVLDGIFGTTDAKEN